MAAMPGNREALIAAFDSHELDPLIALLDERVVWRGLPDNDADLGVRTDRHIRFAVFIGAG